MKIFILYFQISAADVYSVWVLSETRAGLQSSVKLNWSKSESRSFNENLII